MRPRTVLWQCRLLSSIIGLALYACLPLTAGCVTQGPSRIVQAEAGITHKHVIVTAAIRAFLMTPSFWWGMTREPETNLKNAGASWPLLAVIVNTPVPKRKVTCSLWGTV